MCKIVFEVPENSGKNGLRGQPIVASFRLLLSVSPRNIFILTSGSVSRSLCLEIMKPRRCRLRRPGSSVRAAAAVAGVARLRVMFGRGEEQPLEMLALDDRKRRLGVSVVGVRLVVDARPPPRMTWRWSCGTRGRLTAFQIFLHEVLPGGGARCWAWRRSAEMMTAGRIGAGHRRATPMLGYTLAMHVARLLRRLYTGGGECLRDRERPLRAALRELLGDAVELIVVDELRP